MEQSMQQSEAKEQSAASSVVGKDALALGASAARPAARLARSPGLSHLRHGTCS